MDELLLRELTPAVIGVLARRGADLVTAEDAVQEALLQAALTWPDQQPADPLGWLVTVAWRKFLDARRSEVSRRMREQRVEVEPPPGPTETADDTLQLFFLCAHPSLTPASAVALTLRAVGGLTTRQVAQAYLVPEATMAQRISRAKRTVRDVRFDQPGDLATVRRVLYLVFNEGHTGDVDLAAEAIRLTRQLASATAHKGTSDEETAGLLALMLLHHARRRARTQADGSLVPWPSRTAPDGTPRSSPRASRSCRPRWLATGSASSRPRPPSPPCTPTRRAPRRPTGFRSSAGTTSCSGSPGARSRRSTGPSRSARQMAREPASRPWPRWTPACPATPPPRRTSTRRRATFRPRHGCMPTPPGPPPTLPNVTTSPGRRRGSVKRCVGESP